MRQPDKHTTDGTGNTTFLKAFKASFVIMLVVISNCTRVFAGVGQLCLWDHDGYLHTVGPAPIRYLKPPVLPLPPKPMVETLANTNSGNVVIPNVNGGNPGAADVGSGQPQQSADGQNSAGDPANPQNLGDSRNDNVSSGQNPTTFIQQNPTYVIQNTKLVKQQLLTNDAPSMPQVVSPQMLMKYFNKVNKTNSTYNTTILEPMDLRPARPLPTPQSRATYSN